MRVRRNHTPMGDRLRQYYKAMQLMPTVQEQITLARERVARLTALIDGDGSMPSQGVARWSQDPSGSHGSGDEAMLRLVQQHEANQLGLRRELYEVQHSLDQLMADEYALMAEINLLGGILRLLSSDAARIIEGVYQDDMTMVQLSERLAMDESTVRYHLNNAMADIRRYLGWFPSQRRAVTI